MTNPSPRPPFGDRVPAGFVHAYKAPPAAVRRLAAGYVALFGRRAFYRFSELLFTVAARGMCVTDPMGRPISPAELHFLKRLSRIQSPVVFDVGANVGEYSLAVLRHCPSAAVWAFEPNPIAFVGLSQNAASTGFTAVGLALSDRPETTTMFDDAARPGSPHATLHEGIIEDLHSSNSAPIQVQTTTLDKYVGEIGVDRIDLLKIDVEGHELTVLKGASRALEEGRIDIIQFEFNEMNVFYRVFLHDFYETLTHYTLYRMVVDGLVPLRGYRPRSHEIFFGHNIVAIHDRSRHSRLFA